MRMRIKPMTADFIPPVYKTEGAACSRAQAWGASMESAC